MTASLMLARLPVCRTWSQFVTCVKRYIDRCFTESRRQEFNKAVENPVDSVYQMCTVPQYQGGERLPLSVLCLALRIRQPGQRLGTGMTVD